MKTPSLPMSSIASISGFNDVLIGSTTAVCLASSLHYVCAYGVPPN
jgi:hypothetical protein